MVHEPSGGLDSGRLEHASSHAIDDPNNIKCV